MSCGSPSFSSSGNCVVDTVRRILEAQRKAAKDLARGCTISCERSIEDLLSPGVTMPVSRNTTVPFILFTGKGGKPFIGSGFVPVTDNDTTTFQCLESPVFKVRGFERNSKYCVKLELLTPVADDNGDTGTFTDCSLCSAYENMTITNFQETGLCITVDLRCFCGITCLDPITPDPINNTA